MIRLAVVCQRDSTGQIHLRKVKGSSISLPMVDEQRTRAKIEQLMTGLVDQMPVEGVLSAIKETISDLKSNYTQTHNGFRVAKGSGKSKSLTIADLYSLVVATSYCFDFLPVTKYETERRVAIGVMAPAVQDAGKNLIKLVWRAAGFEVHDLGNTVPPADWVKEMVSLVPSAIGISCMTNRCLSNVRRLLASLSEHGASVPVILGGIAVNKLIAFDLTKEYGLPVHYGRDVTDAVAVLEKVLAGTSVEVPVVREVERLEIPPELIPVVERQGFNLYRIGIADIVIDKDARRGCSACSGDKRRLCPLENGYEDEKSLEESTGFVNRFKFAVLVMAENPDEEDRATCKSMWESLLRLEQYFDTSFNSAQAFKFAMTCPFCPPSECGLPKGECTFPYLYRQLHEQYHINVPSTLVNAFGDAVPPGNCAIILVR
jgi:methanogenic corrinoid protein MtbC1